ncbi:MAG: hypothetical protein AAF292_12830 [Pseudomonadota bacterium]
MTAALRMIRWDILLQIRGHLYSATAISTLALCLVGYLIQPLDLSPKWLSLLLFTDPAIIGLSFVGAFVLVERGTNTLSALATSPLQGRTYVLGKVVSFSILGTLSGGLVAVVASGGSLKYPVMATSLVLTNVAAIIVGFALVSRASSVNRFITSMSFALAIGVLPLVPYFASDPSPLMLSLVIIPSYSMLTVLEAGFSGSQVSVTEYVISSGYLLLWIIAGWGWSVREYETRLRTYER